MKQKVHSFNKALYKKCKEELCKKTAKEIISYYDKNCKLKGVYGQDFLSHYYSPILTTLKQFFGEVENKQILEIGYRVPMFLDYLKKCGASVYGIDIEPSAIHKTLLKMSVENINKKFLKEYENQFDVIIERITLSRLYDEKYFLETGNHRFKNKEKILLNLYRLLNPKGILVLQDDRGSIFTEAQFAKVGFRKVMKETPIVFRDKQRKDFGWNVLVVYRKLKSQPTP